MLNSMPRRAWTPPLPSTTLHLRLITRHRCHHLHLCCRSRPSFGRFAADLTSETAYPCTVRRHGNKACMSDGSIRQACQLGITGVSKVERAGTECGGWLRPVLDSRTSHYMYPHHNPPPYLKLSPNLSGVWWAGVRVAALVACGCAERTFRIDL